MPLTDPKVRNAKPRESAYTLADGEALFLVVSPKGVKTWRYRYRMHGKQQTYTIGRYPDYSLAEARAKRDEARKLVERGIHPTRHKKAERARRRAESANTFKAVAEEWRAKKVPAWGSERARQVKWILQNDVYPKIGDLPMREINAPEILDILQTAESRGAETVALLIRQICSAVFRYAAATHRADHDPAAALRDAVQRPKVQHRAPLEQREIPNFLERLHFYRGRRETKIALKVLLYTFVRPSELREATWSEFDLDSAEWRIPAERMKMGEPHIVPLAPQVVALLRELYTLTGHQQWLFPNIRRPKEPMTATTLNRALENMGYGGKFSSHGFRATAATILNEQGWNPDYIERQLAHAPRNKVRAAYNRAQYLTERRTMLESWANFIDGLAAGASVVPIRTVEPVYSA